MFLNIKGILTVLKVVSRSGMGRMAILRMCFQSGYTLVIQEKFFNILLPGSLSFPDGSSSKESVCNAGDTGDVGLILGSGRSPGEGKWQPTPVFLPGESHGQRSLAGYSPWGCKESDVTEHTHTHTRCLDPQRPDLFGMVTAWEPGFL